MNLKILRRAGAWIATAAMALNAAWPLLAQARPFDPLGEICSARSPKAGIDHDRSSGFPGGGGECSHCTLCSLAPCKVLTLSGNAPVFAASPREAILPSSTDAIAARAPLLYPPAHPRAPPLAS